MARPRPYHSSWKVGCVCARCFPLEGRRRPAQALAEWGGGEGYVAENQLFGRRLLGIPKATPSNWPTPRTSHSFNLRVDAHVLATPAIADIDGDGHDELVAVVSYFYDRDYYEDEVSRPAVLLPAVRLPVCHLGHGVSSSCVGPWGGVELLTGCCLAELSSCEASRCWACEGAKVPPCSCQQRHRQELGLDVDISKYLAVGVIVYDLNRQTVKWRQVGVGTILWWRLGVSRLPCTMAS